MPSLRAARNPIVIACTATIVPSLIAATVDSRQRLLGQDILEAAYDAADGRFAPHGAPASEAAYMRGVPVRPAALLP